ncbi:hypothetical protein B0H19DRAFT_1383685 [Mycena capillaripes]|nr:hypothetical protein B0H19DRAFT_1383685 [Mycena capillaripes]
MVPALSKLLDLLNLHFTLLSGIKNSGAKGSQDPSGSATYRPRGPTQKSSIGRKRDGDPRAVRPDAKPAPTAKPSTVTKSTAQGAKPATSSKSSNSKGGSGR